MHKKQPEQKQKHFLARFEVQDGENKYKEFCVYSAKKSSEAVEIARRDMFECDNLNNSRETNLEWVEEITLAEERILSECGVV